MIVAAVKSKATIVWGRVGESKMEMMLDSSSIVSSVHQEVLSQAQGYTTCFEAPKQL